jgi:hypothetical protein
MAREPKAAALRLSNNATRIWEDLSMTLTTQDQRQFLQLLREADAVDQQYEVKAASLSNSEDEIKDDDSYKNHQFNGPPHEIKYDDIVRITFILLVDPPPTWHRIPSKVSCQNLLKTRLNSFGRAGQPYVNLYPPLQVISASSYDY